ncbi:hypothetical protein GCM10007028_33530 [Algibacter mikhailovii]|uniref:Uncharacterized protein n=1 Tax=Algibacter mikhailovii TaxID=425498 RepID=A0A918RBC1_9FLAO|nr:hypothetical protein GCM10007028_33530 [Algibacter mikhailovii]
MTNVFEHIREHGPYKKFTIDELLFVEFKCVSTIKFGNLKKIISNILILRQNN